MKIPIHLNFRALFLGAIIGLQLHCAASDVEKEGGPIRVEIPRFEEMVDQDWFTNLHYVPLCTGDAAVQVHELAKIRYHEDHLYVLSIDQGIERQLFKFTLDGELLAKLPNANDRRLKSGRIEDILIANDTLHVIDSGRGAIYRYDTDLQFVDMVSYPDTLSVKNIGYHPNSGAFAFRTSEPYGTVSPVYIAEDVRQPHIAFAEELGAYTDNAAANFPFMFFENFATYEEDLLYHDLFSSDIWQYGGDTFIKAYTLDFADQLFISDEELHQFPPGEVERQFELIQRSGKAINLDHVGQIGDNLYVTFGDPKKYYLVIFDERGTVLRQAYVPMLSKQRNTIDSGPDLDFPIGVLNNSIVFVQDIETIELYGENKSYATTKISNIREVLELDDTSCNKVLVFATLKAMD